MIPISKQLDNAPAWENPTHKIAVEIAQMQERGASWAEVQAIEAQIDAALQAGRGEGRAIANALASLEGAEAVSSAIVPIGF